MNLVPLRCVPSESVSASNMYIHSPGHNLGANIKERKKWKQSIELIQKKIKNSCIR